MGLKEDLEKLPWLRPRKIVTLLLPLLAILAGIWIDPDPGDYAVLQLTLAKIAMCAGVFSLAVLIVNWNWDYKEADTRAHLTRVLEHGNVASAIWAATKTAAILVVFTAILAALAVPKQAHGAQLDARTFVPANCVTISKLVKAEQRSLWPDHPEPAFEMASVEQETCVRLDSKRCCTGKAQLKTEREEGATLLQVTRTYRKDGSLRFDKLAEMRARYPELAGWSWDNVYDRDDLAARALILSHRSDFRLICKTFEDKLACLPFVAYAHNGGAGSVIEDRQLCKLKKGCNNKVWVGHVELTSSKSRVSLGPKYGNRSPHDISREYPRLVVIVRMPKYRVVMT